MQFEEELFFRKLAEEGDIIESSQLEECLEIQRNNPNASSLFVIMIEKGYINHKNMGGILKKVPPQMQPQNVLISPKTPKKFGELCVEKGFATSPQVAECLKIQERLKQEGKHMRIGQILLEKKYVAIHHAQMILELQGKKILRCPTCETKYNIRHFKSDKKYQCPKCNGDLLAYEVKAGSFSINVERSFMTRETVEVDDEALALINKKIGDYTIVELLGEGGMATVYKAVSEHKQRVRALKVMKSQAGQERFTREFENASALRHPNIIRVYERGVFEASPYFFMEYIDGGTLAKRVEKMGVISLIEGLNILKQVAMGLKYAHENNIVHRDIKTNNIMLTRDSHNKILAKITDFGIARAVSDSHITMTGQLVGTFKYMAPEYIKGSGIEGKSDIFSLGIVAYEMFTGQEPFQVDAPVGYLFVNIKETPLPIHQRNPDLPKSLTLLINQMLAKDVRKRYDASALLRDLDRFLRHLQEGTVLYEAEDKTSVFYNRGRFPSLKGLWERISQSFSSGEHRGGLAEPIVSFEQTQRRPLSAPGQWMGAETEEVPKETTAQKQYEFAMELIEKGNPQAAKQNLMGIIEIFPGTSWAARAKKKLHSIEHPNSPEVLEDETIKKKAPLKAKKSEDEPLGKTQIKVFPKEYFDHLDQMSVESPGKITTQEYSVDTQGIYIAKEVDSSSKESTDLFESLAPSKEKETSEDDITVSKGSMVRKAQDILVSVKAFIDNVKNIDEYEQKKPWLDDILSYLSEVPWPHAHEEISEIFYKWGRFLLDHGKYREGMFMFWDIYDKFPNTRWHSHVFEELVAMEQPEDMKFIEGGNFCLGEGKEEIQIEIKPYFIDISPVTNAQYWKFVKDTGYTKPIHWIGDMYPIGKANHPVVWICAEDAMAYARWRGKRLPTEVEWEKAARGTHGLLWPWGNFYESRRCNSRESNIGDTTAVGTYEQGRSPYNCYDMSGNVWEWTDTWYGQQTPKQRVLKGGSWFTFARFTNAAYRNYDYPESKSGIYGFRCGKSFSRPEKLQE